VALPTFGTFMREAAGRYVALDGRLWRTLWVLVARPGYLTLEYFGGRRRRYIRPARLFLVLYLVLFAVIGLLQSPVDLGEEIVFVDSEASAALDNSGGTKEGETGTRPGTPRNAEKATTLVATDDGDTFLGLDRNLDLTLRLGGADVPMPEQIRKRYASFKKLSKKDKAERLYAGVLRYGPYAMVALLPAFALLLKLAYLGRPGRYPGRPQRYAEHLVYSAHVHAFAALMLLLFLLLPFGPFRFALALWIIYYAMRARQVVYRGRWWGGILRAFVVGIAYIALLSMAIVGLLLLAVMIR